MDLLTHTATRFKNKRHLEESGLHSDFYTNKEIFEIEKEKIFQESWHMVCRTEDVQKPGDYFCDEYLNQKLFVLHGYDGEIRAFANVCRHRWSTLLEEKGSLGEKQSLIICPYHRWGYSFDGKFAGAPGIKDLKCFSKEEHGLHALRLHIWNGFIFITLSKMVPAFSDYVGDYQRLVAPYHNNLRCVRKTNYEIEANWKGYIEVDMETYHTPSVHPGSIGIQEVEIIRPIGQYIGVYHPCEDTVALRPEERHLAFPHIEGLEGKQKYGTYFCVILPSLFIVNTLDSMWWIHKVPVAEDRTQVRCGFAFPESTIARSDFNERAPKYYDRWDTVIEEDNWIVERQYQGIKSNQFTTPGRYAASESVVFDFDSWVLSRLT